MGEIGDHVNSWINDDGRQSTEPGISVQMIAEEGPTLTVAAIIGVTLVIIITIVAVFLLGVLIDCRHQRIVAKRLGEVKRPKNQRRVSAHPQGDTDDTSIVSNMEQPELSIAPAEMLRTVP